MGMLPTVDKPERPAQGPAKTHRIVPHDRKAATSFRSIERKRRNDCVPPDLQGSLKAHDICSTVRVFGEEVERRPIMPNVVTLCWLPDCCIRSNPVNPGGTPPKAGFSCL